MTISTSTRTAGPFSGNGVTAVLPFTFKVFQESEVSVARTNADGTITTLVRGSAYTVSLNGDQNAAPGGSVTILSPATNFAADTSISLTSAVATTQPMALANAGPFLARQVEDAFDRLTILLQQLQQFGSAQTIRVPDLSGISILPSAAERAGYLLGFDAFGDRLLVPGQSGTATSLALDLASADPAKGTALLVHMPSGSGAAARSLDDVLDDLSPATNFAGVYRNSSTDSSAGIIAAGVAMAAAGRVLTIPAGTYVCHGWTLPAGLVVHADGVTLKRPDSAGGNTTVLRLANGRNVIRGLTIDGNKANNSTAANNIVITGGGDYTLSHVTSKNAKGSGGSYGSGLVVAATSDAADETESSIEHCRFFDNDSDGLFVDETWNLAIHECECSNNGGTGCALANYDAPIEPQSQRAVRITGGHYRGNTGSGVSVIGTPLSNVLPLVADYQAINVRINGTHCEGNAKYGIAAQGTAISVDGNTCIANGNDGGSRITYGGILFNAYLSTCTNNTVGGNEFYGIDAGGAHSSSVSNNTVQFNGNASGGGTGINLGASVNTACRGNRVINNGGQSSATGTQVYCPAYDSNGTTTGGLPYRATGVIIAGNYIEMSASSQAGVYLSQGPSECVVRDNEIKGGSADKAVILQSDSVRSGGNVWLSSLGGHVLASASTLVIPDCADTVVVTGTTTITDIRTYSQNSYYQKVAWCTVTGSGSGYTSPPTVSFSGGGGSGAAAQAYIGDDGKLRGVVVTNAGSGYTSAPTVSLSGGGGSGATVTATVGIAAWGGERKLTMVFAGNAPVTNANGTLLSGGGTFTPGTSGASTLSLIGMYGTNRHETGRMIG